MQSPLWYPVYDGLCMPRVYEKTTAHKSSGFLDGKLTDQCFLLQLRSRMDQHVK